MFARGGSRVRAVPSPAVRYYEDFVPGETATSQGSYVVTEAEIREVGERWDPQPFHVDPLAAARSAFGGLVASSVHLFAIRVALGTGSTEEPTAAVSALGFDKLRLHAPVRPGDELRVRSTTIDRRVSSSRPGLGIVRSRSELVNQRDEVVWSDESAFLVERRTPTTG
jgi:acyl dehydratase